MYRDWGVASTQQHTLTRINTWTQYVWSLIMPEGLPQSIFLSPHPFSLSQTHLHTHIVTNCWHGRISLCLEMRFPVPRVQPPHLISHISFSFFLRPHSCTHTLFVNVFAHAPACISLCWSLKVISHDALHFQARLWRHRHSERQGEIRRRGFPSWPRLQYNGDTHAVLGRAGKALTLVYAKSVCM